MSAWKSKAKLWLNYEQINHCIMLKKVINCCVHSKKSIVKNIQKGW